MNESLTAKGVGVSTHGEWIHNKEATLEEELANIPPTPSLSIESDIGNILVVFGSRGITPGFGLLNGLAQVHGTRFNKIISGGARGVDTQAEEWAEYLGIDFEEFPANWDSFGSYAGHRRNGEMARVATHGICVWDGFSKGTEDMLRKMREAGKPVVVYVVSRK